jgi:hypothetical protein
MAEAKKDAWTVISMKNDWKVIFRLKPNERAERRRLYVCRPKVLWAPRQPCAIIYASLTPP